MLQLHLGITVTLLSVLSRHSAAELTQISSGTGEDTTLTCWVHSPGDGLPPLSVRATSPPGA